MILVLLAALAATTIAVTTDCGPLADFLLGHTTVGSCSSTGIDSSCTAVCSTGYTPVPGVDPSLLEGQFLCTTFGWTGNQLECQQYDCGAFPNPPNGVATCNGTTYGSNCVSGCGSGYSHSGAVDFVCKTTTDWTLTSTCSGPAALTPACAKPACFDTNGCVGSPCDVAVSTCVDRRAPLEGYDCVCSPGLAGVPGASGKGCVAPSIGLVNGSINVAVGGGLDIVFAAGTTNYSTAAIVTSVDDLVIQGLGVTLELISELSTMQDTVDNAIFTENNRSENAIESIYANTAALSTSIMKAITFSDSEQTVTLTGLQQRITNTIIRESARAIAAETTVNNAINTNKLNVLANLDGQLRERGESIPLPLDFHRQMALLLLEGTHEEHQPWLPIGRSVMNRCLRLSQREIVALLTILDDALERAVRHIDVTGLQ